MPQPKKLIEVALPIKEISAESKRDVKIQHGHIGYSGDTDPPSSGTEQTIHRSQAIYSQLKREILIAKFSGEMARQQVYTGRASAGRGSGKSHWLERDVVHCP